MPHSRNTCSVKSAFRCNSPVVDYAATVEGMAANKLDLVWFGGLTHVQARIRTNNTAYAIAMVKDLQFKSVFITNPQANIKSLQELKGKNLRLRQVQAQRRAIRCRAIFFSKLVSSLSKTSASSA